MKKRKVIFYRDELNDEFSTAQITPKRIDGSYRYCHDSLWKRFTHFFWYRIVATPIAYGYVKAVLGQKTVGREQLKPYRKTGYFLYGNHTQIVGDAFLPSILTFPKTCYTIVHPNNVSMPILGRVTPSMGALPLPDDMDAYRKFLRAVDRRIDEGHAVVIYPEAHIWPFYTKIRPFPDFYGYLMRNCNPLPLSSHHKTLKKFSDAVSTLLRDGHFVLVYPEQSMWWNYRKPKPLKKGAYIFAAKNNVPVLPCFITMKDSDILGKDGFPVQEYTIHVATPIYPDQSLRYGEKVEKLAAQNFAIWKEIYETEYGIPLIYTTESTADEQKLSIL